MKNELSIPQTLKTQDFSQIDIDLILNYLQTLDYDLKKTRYIGKIISKNERLAKYFFFREKLQIKINSSDETFHFAEILDQCIDWREFWRLLVVKKGFCCIRIPTELSGKARFVFLSGPNILSDPTADQSDSIYQHVDY